MFTYEEMEILEEMDLLSIPVETCVRRLQDNVDNIEDVFAKEFLREMILKIEVLTDREYAELLDKAFWAYA